MKHPKTLGLAIAATLGAAAADAATYTATLTQVASWTGSGSCSRAASVSSRAWVFR